MPVWAGIDEAGYGPTLGPLVLAAVAIRDARVATAEPPDLWDRLTASVTDRSTTGRTSGRSTGSSLLWIADSKRVYRAGGGLARLEEAVLAALQVGPTRHAPHTVGELWAGLSAAWPGADGAQHPPWYGAEFAARALPTAARVERLNSLANAWSDNLHRAGLALSWLSCLLITESDFNRRVAQTANKANAHLGWTLDLLRSLWREHRGQELTVVADKLGGRNFYAAELSRTFPYATVQTLTEGSAMSQYRMTVAADHAGPADALVVRFEAKADRRHLPTALAAMIAKYVRELVMRQFNHWWNLRLPGLAPTAGYPLDARRFLSAVGTVADAPPRPLWVRDR